jgi:hypothetical protein
MFKTKINLEHVYNLHGIYLFFGHILGLGFP